MPIPHKSGPYLMMKIALTFCAISSLLCGAWQSRAADSAGSTNPPPATVEKPSANAPTAFDPAARNIRFQFDGMPYMDVIERFAQMVDKPLIAQTNIQGTLTYNDPRAYNYAEAIDTLNLILATKQVMLIEADHFLRLVPFQQLGHLPFKVFHGLEQVTNASPGEIVTVVMNLKNLEASETAQSITPMLSEAGSVAPFSRGRGLIITDRVANIQRVRQLLAQIDSESLADRQMRTFTLLHASGAVLSDVINKTFGVATAPTRTVFNQAQKKYEVLPADPSDYVTAIFDDPSHTLIIYGPRDRVSLAEDLIKKFEDQNGGQAGEVRIFTPQSMRVEDLSRMLRQAVPSIAATNEPASSAAIKARLIVDSLNNRLIATGPIGSQLDEIEKFIKQIDEPNGHGATNSPATATLSSKVFRLENADPSSVVTILTSALAKQSGRNSPLGQPNVSVDLSTRSVVVTGSPADLLNAADILQQLDKNPALEEETQFVNVGTAAEVNRLLPLIRQIYQREPFQRDPNAGGPPYGRRRFSEPLARISSDPESGRIIITGVPTQVKKVEGIITMLRGQSNVAQTRQLHIRPLQSAKVDAILKPITDLVTERLRDANFNESLRPLLLPDSANNRLLVTATDDQWKVIEQTIAAFDIVPDNADRQLQIIPLRTKSAQEIIPIVLQLASQTPAENSRRHPEPKLMPDANGKQLILLADPEDQQRIQKIIEQLDGGAGDGSKRLLRVLTMNGRTATEVVPLLEKLYKEQLVGETQPPSGPASFVAEPKNNRILVSGAEPEVARAEAILRQLDPPGLGSGEETRVIRLENAVATELAGIVEKTVNNPQESVKVLVDPRSNSIVLTGPSRGIELATHIVHQLDTKGSLQPREIRILELHSAQAATLAPMVTQLFTELARDAHGAAYNPTARIVPEEKSNRLIASGNKDDLDQIEKLVKQLDDGQNDIARVFKLKKARATDLVQTLTAALVQRDPYNRFIQRVSVSSDRASNSVVVSGSKADLDAAALLIEKLDQEAQQKSRAIKFIEIKSGEPTRLAALASQLFKAQHAEEPGIEEVQITPEPDAKRLIVLTPEPLQAPLLELIQQLDQLPPSAPRELHFVETKPAPAISIAPIVSRIYQEENRGRDTYPPSIYPVGGFRLSVIGSEEQTKAIQRIVDTLQLQWQNRGPRVTKLFPIGPTEEVQRLQTLATQLYQDEMRGQDPSDPADAQILPDMLNGQLIVTGRTNHLAKIIDILDRLKSAGAGATNQTRVYDLETANAAELSTTVRSLFEQELKTQPGAHPSKALILPDPAANRLVVSGATHELDMIERIVKTLDTVNAQSSGTKIFQLKYSNAQQMASVLSTALVEVNRFGRSVPRVSIGSDPTSNTLIVSGQPKDLQSAVSIIEQLDAKNSKEPRQMHIIPLKAGHASEISTRLRQLYLDKVKNEPLTGETTPLLMGDDASNRLIITASNAQMAIIEEMVRQLEEGAAASSRQLRLFFLTKNSAGALAAIASQIFAQDLRGADGTPKAMLTAAPDDRTLVVDAAPALLDRVEQLVKSLDGEQSEAGVEVRTYHLQEGNASELAPTLSRLFQENNPGRRSISDTRFEADTTSNTLIVAAPKTQFEKIESLIKQLKTPVELAQEIRSFKLSHIDAQQAASILEDMLTRGGRLGNRSFRMRYQSFSTAEEIRVTAAPTLNSVLIQAPPQKLLLAEQIIQSLDKPQTEHLAAIRAVHLRKAQADAVAEAVNQSISARQDPNQPRRVSVTAIPASNSLLINGSPDEIQAVVKLIQELDSESLDSGEEVRVFRIEHGDARDFSRIITQFLQNQGRGRFRSQRGSPVLPSVSFDERINALVVSGSAHHFKLVEELLQALDRSPERPDREIQSITLENALAEDVADKAKALFSDRPRREQPVIEPDLYGNSITIIAKKGDLVQIEDIIKRLDVSAHDNSLQVRFIPLDRIPAEQMARTLKTLYSQMSTTDVEIVDRLPESRREKKNQTGPPATPNAQTNAPPTETKAPTTTATAKQPVIIAVEKNSNSLILSGHARDLDELDRIISDLSFSFISSDAEFRQFRLKEADPVMVAKTLTELFRPEAIPQQQRGGQGQGQRAQTAAAPQQPQPGQPQVVIPPPKVAVVAEPRTRSIIVRAKPADFILLETLIKQLDAENITPQLQFRLIQLTNAEPVKILPLVQQLITQLNNLRQGEPLSAVADQPHRALFLVGRDVLLDQVQDLIRSLDTPVPVGETEILVIPLKRARSGQLSALLSQMLRPDAAGQLTPEARELQEQVRRLKITNSKGESITLDLRKPIKIMAESAGQGPSPGNRIIVSSTPDNLAALAAVVDMMDRLPLIDGVSVRFVPLAHADATALQQVLDTIFQSTGTPPFRREDRPIITVDPRTNALILAGDERNFELVLNLIQKLDQEVSLDLKGIHIVHLENADAAELAPNLQRILDARVQQKAALSKTQADSLRVIVIADTRTNSLLIGGSQEGFELAQSLVQELDKAGPGLAGRIRLIPLQNANAGSLSRSLIIFFSQRYQAARNPDVARERPIIIADLRSNSLLVSSGIEDAKIIDELLLKLDRKTENPAVSLTVIPLRNNDSARVSSMLQALFTARLRSMSVPGQPPLPQDQVDIEPDSLSNSLVVSASPENLAEVKRLVEQLDVEPTGTGGVLEMFTLQYADAQRAASMLRALVAQGLYRPGAAPSAAKTARDALAITVDAASNTLFVSASPENLLLVRQLIKQVDSKDFTTAGDIQLFRLKNARASHVAMVLEQFFRSKRAGEAQGGSGNQRSIPVTVTADDRTNTILVTGGKETFTAIQRIIDQLDSSEIAAKTNFRVFPLKNSTASKLQAMLQELFLKRPSRMQGQPPEPITMVSDAWANALIVGASDEDMPMIESLIERLDNNAPQPGIAVRVFPLAKGDARRVAQTIQSLYREGNAGTTAPVTINVDDRLNALVISAGEADVQRIAELVKKLDTDAVARIAEIRIIELRHAQADELAMILTRALTTRAPAVTEQNPNSQLLLQLIDESVEGKKLIASALKEGVLITPDRRVNSLIVSAPTDSMHLLEQLIARLDAETPQLAKIKMFSLKNADARQMADMLTALFHLQQVNNPNVSQRSVQYTLASTNALPAFAESTNLLETVSAVVGSPAEPVLTVTVDTRTNSLLVGGSAQYLSLAEKIILELDSTPGREREAEVYRLKNSQAQKIEVALRTFLDQERQRITSILGPAGLGTAQNMLDREVAIVAEPLSNTLLISANPRYRDQIKALIQELDQPQAQVLIQVLLAEVTLDKETDLGFEWNYASKGSPSFKSGTDFGIPAELKNFGGFSSAVTGDNFNFILRALESEGRLEVLSRPQILTADNMEAMINVGQRVPLVTDSRVTERGDTINQFQYQSIGVMMTVTPRISPDGFVKMDISTTNSELSSSTVDISQGVQIPIINERKATTTVSVQSGQTIIIGGLISTTDDARIKKVPWLGNIPVIGALFRSSKAKADRKELLIILTPQVLIKEEGEEGLRRTPLEMTTEQLRNSTIKERERDALQKKVLDPVFEESPPTETPPKQKDPLPKPSSPLPKQ